MKSIEWIDKLITERSLPSDRQAAILIGMSVTTLSSHRVGRLTTLDDKYAYRMEELLGLEHGKIVLDQHAERERDPNISAMWRKLASTAAAFVFLCCAVMTMPNKANATEARPLTFIIGTIEGCHSAPIEPPP